MLKASFPGHMTATVMLAAWRTTLFVAFWGAGSLDSVGLAAGALLAGAVFAAALYATHGWLRAVLTDGPADMASRRYWMQSAWWGARGGVAFALLIAAGFTLFGIPIAIARDGLAEGLKALIFPVLIAVIGAPVGFLVGGVWGMIFGLFDGLMLKAWRKLAR